MVITIKKTLCKLVAFATVSLCTASLVIPAAAANPNPFIFTNRSDIASFSDSETGDFCRVYAYPDETRVKSIVNGYNGAWKEAECMAYGNNGSYYYFIDGDYNYGTANPVIQTVSYDPNEIAMRYHNGIIRLTSNSTSTVMDDLTIIVRKN